MTTQKKPKNIDVNKTTSPQQFDYDAVVIGTYPGGKVQQWDLRKQV